MAGELNPGGLGCAFFEKMQEHGDKIAQVDGITGQTETYKSLLQRCVRTALAMRSKGVTQDDFINICSIASTDICVPFIATLLLGAKPTTLDSNYSLIEITLLLKQVKPKIIFAGPEVVEKIEKAVEEIGDVEIVVFGGHTKHTSFEEFLKPNSDDETFKPVPAKDLKETALILFSSGTSGLPKGICLHHFGFLMMASQASLQITRILTFASFNWISTINLTVSSIINGNSRIVVPTFNPETFWKLLDTHQPDMVFLAPVQLAILTRHRRPSPPKPYLKLVIASGGPISENHMLAFRALVPEAIVSLIYAQTELFGPLTMYNPRVPEQLTWLKNKPTCCGPVLPNASIRIVDPQTEEELGLNQKGELRVKSSIIMNGYYNIDSSEAWDKDGWLKTGDIAYLDDDRCLYIVDRVKEMFKFRSFHVVPTFVEGILQQHPAVEDAVVIGIPHEEDGDHPRALVVISKHNKNVTPKEIEQFVEERVGDAQRLRAGVKFVDWIPRTSTGKIKRKEIKERVFKGEM